MKSIFSKFSFHFSNIMEMNLGILSRVKQLRGIVKAKGSQLLSNLGQQKPWVHNLQTPRKSQKKNITPKDERTL